MCDRPHKQTSDLEKSNQSTFGSYVVVIIIILELSISDEKFKCSLPLCAYVVDLIKPVTFAGFSPGDWDFKHNLTQHKIIMLHTVE